jgi:transcriptional regulator with XRE-family HTH domain
MVLAVPFKKVCSMSRNSRRPPGRSQAKSSAVSRAKVPTAQKSALVASAGMASPSTGGPSVERGLTAFGERLVSTLQMKGMSDSELAKALGIAQPNIHTLKYKTDRPRHKTVLKIAKVLGVTPEALLPQATLLGAQTAAEGTKVYLVIESKQGRQTIRLA